MIETFAFAAIWVGAGLSFYHLARKSWIRRWGTDDAPFNYFGAALLGFGALGFWLAELDLSKDD